MKTIMQSITKRLATMLLFAAATLMPQVANAAGTQPSGDGTTSSPYKIATASNLLWFADKVNSGNASINAVLTADIVVNTNVLNASGELNGAGSGFSTWTPIGLDEDGKKYRGIFDGQGHTISGLYINSGSIQNAGLFSANMGEIKNVGIVDSYFYASENIGALCGINYGTISNCYNTGAVGPNAGNYFYIGGVCGQNHGGTIDNCYNTGKVNANTDGGYYGGVCGKNINSGTISRCYNSSEIILNAKNKTVGGVCGYNFLSYILNCYNFAKITASGIYQIIGGVCGYNHGGNIANCYNSGLLLTAGVDCGSVCGYNEDYEVLYEDEWDTFTFYYDGEIYNAYYLEGTADKGVGTIYSGSVELLAKTAEQFATGEVAWLLNGGTTEGELTWYQNLSENTDAYPVLDCTHGKVYHGYDCCKLAYSNSPLPTTSSVFDNGFCTVCGSGHPAMLDSDGYYEITDTGHLHWFAEQVNSGETTIKGKLTADITLSGSTDDYMIGTSDNPFKGEFDGGNHTISGVNVTTAKTGVNNNQYVAGLFGCINASDDAATAVVKDLTVEGKVNITGLTTKYYAGGVIGIAYGNVNVSNITSRVDVTTGSDGQKGHCGGVVASGEWFGSTNGNLNVSKCVNYGTLNVACADVCGGVIGYIRKGSITDCLNVGDITNSEDGHTSGVLGYVREGGASMSRCLNVGHVTNDNHSSKVNPVCHINGTVSTSDLYYKSGVCGTATNATEVSGEELESGAVAWLLNGSTAEGDVAWYQNLSDNADAYPVLDSSHGRVYCIYDNDEMTYSNVEHYHQYDADDFCTICGSGRSATLGPDGFYEIANAGQLYWFAEQVNSGNYGINAKLTADIVVNKYVLNANRELNGDGSGFRTWPSIGNLSEGTMYEGTFDGHGYTISGLYVNCASKTGLFAALASDGVIKNVGVIDSYFCETYYVGGVCYNNYGTVENCFNAATCKAEQAGAGGIVGWNYGTIANCHNTGAISSNSLKGAVCAYNRGGGTITNCYYLKGSCTKGVGSGSVSGMATEKTAEQFASGEVAWLLNDSEAGESPAWRQTIGEDEYPVLDAKQGIVIHTTPTSLNSIVRPTAGAIVGADVDVYNFAGIKGTDVYGIEHNGALAPNHPYIFMTEKDINYVSFVPSDEEVTDATPTCGLTGVLDPAGKKVYGNDESEETPVSIVFTAEALKYANKNGNTVKYGKCYINAEECFITDEPVGASKIAPAFEDGVDGLENVSIDSVEGETYNLQGIPVSDNYKGFIIQNGRKLLRR